jgi:maltose alpha-D-glucosyltransferase/alpha-amylase
MIDWLKKAVFYEIYPQSFYDSNGDGIGDFGGIMKKLDYIKGLGANALWINPCFDSPFKDAGYDVRDYKMVAARYGTNEDLYELFAKAHEKGIHVLLDLVPGHTSEEHPWFIQSGKAKPNEYSGRFIWTDGWIVGVKGHPYIGGECERDGTYMLNFFKCQPALNYGFFKPQEPWQKPMNDPDCLATREAVKDVIRFWLSKGCDGFRVDMADSLVKDDDENKTGTCAVWRDIFASVRKDFPEAAFVAEWNNTGQAIISAGFDMDFFLNWGGNGYNTLLRDYETPGGDHSYFKADGDGDITRFLREYLPRYEMAKDRGYISLLSCNHDTPRPRRTLSPEELKLAYAVLFTLPGVPFLYYGDEIGMRYLDIPTKEGGYTRTGTRTPMQWKMGKNLGFSTGDEKDLYLPVDSAADAPTVEASEADPDALLHVVRRVFTLRQESTNFDADSPFSVLVQAKDKPFVYTRGNAVCAVNPSQKEMTLTIPEISGKAILYVIGKAECIEESLTIGGGSFVILE